MVAFSSAHLSRGPGPRVSRERCPRPDPASPSRRLRLDLRTGRPSVHRPITRAVPGDSGQRSHLPTALQLSPQRMHRLRARRPSHGRAGVLGRRSGGAARLGLTPLVFDSRGATLPGDPQPRSAQDPTPHSGDSSRRQLASPSVPPPVSRIRSHRPDKRPGPRCVHKGTFPEKNTKL